MRRPGRHTDREVWEGDLARLVDCGGCLACLRVFARNRDVEGGLDLASPLEDRGVLGSHYISEVDVGGVRFHLAWAGSRLITWTAVVIIVSNKIAIFLSPHRSQSTSCYNYNPALPPRLNRRKNNIRHPSRAQRLTHAPPLNAQPPLRHLHLLDDPLQPIRGTTERIKRNKHLRLRRDLRRASLALIAAPLAHDERPTDQRAGLERDPRHRVRDPRQVHQPRHEQREPARRHVRRPRLDRQLRPRREVQRAQPHDHLRGARVRLRECHGNAQRGVLLRAHGGERHRAVLRGWSAARGVQERAGRGVGRAGRVERECGVLAVDRGARQCDFDPRGARAHSERCEPGQEAAGDAGREFVRRRGGRGEVEAADHAGDDAGRGGDAE